MNPNNPNKEKTRSKFGSDWVCIESAVCINEGQRVFWLQACRNKVFDFNINLIKAHGPKKSGL